MALTATVSNSGIARATLNGKVVTVTGVAAGTTTLTIAMPEDNNHYAASPLTVNLVVAGESRRTFSGNTIGGISVGGSKSVNLLDLARSKATLGATARVASVTATMESLDNLWMGRKAMFYDGGTAVGRYNGNMLTAVYDPHTNVLTVTGSGSYSGSTASLTYDFDIAEGV